MKKIIVFSLTGGMLVSPLVPHLSFPTIYQAIDQAFPVYGLVLMIILDICWLWFILLLFYVAIHFNLRNRSANRQIEKAAEQSCLSGSEVC